MSRTVIYVRAKDPEHASDLQRQEDLIRSMLRQKQIDDKEAVVIQDIAAGMDPNRPGWRTIEAMIDQKQISVLAAEDMTRLSRDASVLRRVYAQTSEGLRILTYSGEVMYPYFKQMLAYVAAMQHRRRVRRGLMGALRRGRVVGHAPYGYRVGDGRLVIDAEEAAIVEYAFALAAEGRTATQIARHFREIGTSYRGRKNWHARDIQRVLHSPIYKGLRVWGKQVMKNKHPHSPADNNEPLQVDAPDLRIVSDELWEKAQQQMNERDGNGRNKTKDAA